jgi:hypothetical protein
MPLDAEHVKYTITKTARNLEHTDNTNSIIEQVHKITLNTQKFKWH